MTTVLSTKLTERLNLFFESNKDAIVVRQDPEEKDENARNVEDAAASSSRHSVDEGKEEKDDGYEEPLQPLDASAKELSYELCGNRVRRNFLRHYMMNVKGKKERVFLNSEGLMTSSMPYMKGTLDIELTLNGYFSMYLVGRNGFSKIPLAFDFVPEMSRQLEVNNNLNNGRINGFSKKMSTFTMAIVDRHAVYWFSQANKYRRLANLPLFQQQMLRWRDALIRKREEQKIRRIERKRQINDMIAEARRLGFARTAA